MALYAQHYIPNYITIKEIPNGHLPTDINTSLAQNWANAFRSCQGIRSFPDPFYDTSNATNMQNMFSLNYNISTVPNFNTSNVTDMSNMFYICRNITTIPNFNTSNVTDMHYMFNGCYDLTTVPNFDTSNVTDMRYMFRNCRKFSNIPVLNTSKVRLLNDMFNNCANIQGNLYIESNNVEGAINLFANTPSYAKNIYCHGNTTTYNTIASAMGGTYNANWNTGIYTMENNYAEIPWNGEGIYRFPTNKIQIWSGSGSPVQVIEVTPYTDYNLSSTISVYAPDKGEPVYHNDKWWFDYGGDIKFRFFKDITNMTPDIVDTI